MLNFRNFHPLKLRKKLRKKSINWRITDVVTIVITIIAFFALIALVYYRVRPLELVDIKVPVATDKVEYETGDPVSGLFFGEIHHEGEVRVLREVFCKDYQRRINTDTERNVFRVSHPKKLDGESRFIGNLPEDVPVGGNCIIRFVNKYNIETPFGTRHEEESYYTQNFSIVEEEPEDDSEPDSERNTDEEIRDQPELYQEESADTAEDEQDEGDAHHQQQSNSRSQEQKTHPRENSQRRFAEPITPPDNRGLIQRIIDDIFN